VAEHAGEQQRRDEEQADGEDQGDDQRDADLLLAERLHVFFGHAHGLVGGLGEGLDADDERLDERDDAADDGRLEDRVPDHPADERVLVHADGVVRVAHGERPVVHAAHHAALDHGLAADLCAARAKGGPRDERESDVHESGHPTSQSWVSKGRTDGRSC
jgi:hypothetical protein